MAGYSYDMVGGASMAKNWDTETADTCQLPKLIPDICERCRDYAYCHRQKTIVDFMKEAKNDD